MQQLERAEKFDENRMRAAGRHAPVLDVSIETNMLDTTPVTSAA